MTSDKVISLEPKERLLEKIRSYVESLDLFLEERETAVPLLLKGLKHADPKLKQKVILLLGSFAKEEIARPLYRMVADVNEDEDTRRFASIQLSVIFPFLKEPQPLIDQLLEDLNSGDSALRIHAAFALGWEGNTQAAIPLIELLYDKDVQVQQTAVNALSNLRDDRILNLMIERLEHGPWEQKRSILFNIWRFYSRQEEVKSVYLKYLDHENDELRFDALVLLGSVGETIDCLPAYAKCLRDRDPRIRALALERLDELTGEELLGLRQEIEGMISDPDMGVKKAVLKVAKKFPAGDQLKDPGRKSGM